MKKTMKIFAVMLLAITLVMFLSNNVFAAGSLITNIEQATNVAQNSVNTTKFVSTAGKIIVLLRNFSIIAGVILIIVLGVKYMMGSVEQKSDYQKSFVPLVIGIILVIGATSIASFLFSLM